MKTINRTKNAIIRAALLAGSMLAGSYSIAMPETLTTRVAVQEGSKPALQNVISQESNRLMVEETGDSQNYGVNVQNPDFRLNLGYQNADDQSRVSLTRYGNNGFIGAEYQSLQGTNQDNRLGIFGGLQINPNLDLEAAIDNGDNWRAVLFAITGDESMIGIGGGQGPDGYWEANVTESHMLNDRYGIGTHLRVGDDLLDARVRLGPNVSWQKARAFGIGDGCYNSISALGDITDPFAIGKAAEFNFFSADGCVGDQTGDIGLDVRYIRDAIAYANVAVNLGDVVISPRIHRNLAEGTDGARLGLSTMLGDAKIWYQGTANQGSKPNHALYIGSQMEF